LKLQALLWDVDGTLAETERDGHRVAFNLAFEEFGLDWFWDEHRYGELLRVTGGRERLLLDMRSRADAPDEPRREALAVALHACKNTHYAQLVDSGAVQLRPGVLDLMTDCAAAGVRLAIATTTSRSNVEALLATALGDPWRTRFAAVLCAEDAPLKKPDPQVYHRCLAALDLPASAVLAVEDSPAGVAACVAADVPVIVTRSHYFAHEAVPGALAVGPGLAHAEGWSPATARPGRITLAQCAQWLDCAY